MVELFSYKDAPITLEGQTVVLQIKRLTFDEGEVYRRRLAWFMATRDQPAPATLEAASQLDTELSAFVTQAIGDYVRVKPGQLMLDGTEVTSGAGVVQVFGGSPTVVLALLLAIGAKNEVSPQEKKAWWSLSGSRDSSPEPTATPVPGDGLVGAAVGVDLRGSVVSATAPASPETSPSGSMETST